MLIKSLTCNALHEIAPWSALVTPEPVLSKEGSLAALYSIEGFGADVLLQAGTPIALDRDHSC